MESRFHQFSFFERAKRERIPILCWNSGQPFLIDARYRYVRVVDIDPSHTKMDLLQWAAKNEVRCVGFWRDVRPARRSAQRESTWAAE